MLNNADRTTGVRTAREGWIIPLLNEAINDWKIIHFIFSFEDSLESTFERSDRALIVRTGECSREDRLMLGSNQTLFVLCYEEEERWSFFDYSTLKWFTIINPKFELNSAGDFTIGFEFDGMKCLIDLTHKE